MNNFRIGDLVELKSGSPVMTVSYVNQTGEIECTWFNGQVFLQQTFIPDTLKGLPSR